MYFNLDEMKEIIEKHLEKMSNANTCVLTNNRENLSLGISNILEHISSLKTNIDGKWNDSLAEEFNSGLDKITEDLNEIKTSVDEQFLTADELYKDSYSKLTDLNSEVENYVTLKNEEPKISNYQSYKTINGTTTRETDKSYYSDFNEWYSKYEKARVNCLELKEKILENIEELNTINGLTLEIDTSDINVNISNLGGSVTTLDYATTPVKGFGSNSGISFELTTGNKTYSLSEDDKKLLYAVVASEAAHNKDDALGVTSVILNRCENSGFGATDPISIIKRKGQFEGYFGGSYKRYYNDVSLIPDEVIQAVDDCLNGTRNTDALFFRANSWDDYSSNLITTDGNRYGKN